MAKPPPPSPTSDLDGIGWAAHIITGVLGILSLIATVYAQRADITPTLVVALAVAGILLPILTWFSLQKSRIAWSFLISLSGVLCVMTLFGAPKVRSLVGISLGTALFLPALFVVALFGLSVAVHRYKE